MLKNKILNSGLAGLLMLSNGCGFYRIPKNVLEQFNIPKKYENYRADGLKFFLKGPLIIDNVKFYTKFYDADGDGNLDALESFPYLTEAELSHEPLFYAFDIDNDRKFNDKEILIDEKMDGLNGNEMWINLGEHFNIEL